MGKAQGGGVRQVVVLIVNDVHEKELRLFGFELAVRAPQELTIGEPTVLIAVEMVESLLKQAHTSARQEQAPQMV